MISSVRPELTSAGQLILHRHLARQPDIQCKVYGTEPARLTLSSGVRRLVGRLAQTRLRRWAHDFWAWRDGRWLDALLPQKISHNGSTVVMTVAQGDACGAARRFAQKHRLPLVTFFHDWWPDMPSCHPAMRKVLERQFQRLYRDSAISFCVCDGMMQALGGHPGAQVLLPIPAKRTLPPQSHCRPPGPFRLLYFGNLREYGPILGEALEALRPSKTLRLEVRGQNPLWPVALKVWAAQTGHWLEFASRKELEAWMDTANACLVPMMFQPNLRRRMETSFPSKMLEMAQLGKPLVIWGPEYCSAARWAQSANKALVVTNPNPKVLRQALEQLAAAPGEQQRLAAAAREAAAREFNPDRIQAQFWQAIDSTLHGQICKTVPVASNRDGQIATVC